MLTCSDHSESVSSWLQYRFSGHLVHSSPIESPKKQRQETHEIFEVCNGSISTSRQFQGSGAAAVASTSNEKTKPNWTLALSTSHPFRTSSRKLAQWGYWHGQVQDHRELRVSNNLRAWSRILSSEWHLRGAFARGGAVRARWRLWSM